MRVKLIILEGIRRSGKSYTIDLIEQERPDRTVYKDNGVRDAIESGLDIDVFAMARDRTISQLMHKFPKDKFDLFVFDRQYLSTYVYAQVYRNKFCNRKLADHIHRIEDLYGDLLDSMTILYLDVEEQWNKIISIKRNKDKFDSDEIDSYKRQKVLYEEALAISRAKRVRLRSFSDNKTILKAFDVCCGDGYIIEQEKI